MSDPDKMELDAMADALASAAKQAEPNPPRSATMSEINEEQVMIFLLDRLIGPVSPVGETHTDDKRMENLKLLSIITHHLTEQLYDVSRYSNSDFHSMKEAGVYARKALYSLSDYYDQERDDE